MNNRKINILFTIPNFKTAGSQQVVLSLFENLNNTLFKPFVCVESYPEQIPEIIPEERRLIFRFTGLGPGDFRKFRKLLKANQIDIVHSWDYKSNYTEALATRFSNVKYLYTKKNNSWNKRWFLKSLISHHIAYDNPLMEKRFFKSFFLKNKITFIPHGVDLNRFLRKKKIQKDIKNLICVGNINKNKNQLYILKSLKELPKDIILHLYGNENQTYKKELLEYINTHHLTDQVVFNGYVSNTKLPSILHKMDVFVLASVNEGLPVSLLEAMASGLLVLSSDSGGGSKYILGEERIFDITDKNSLKNKLQNLMTLEEEEIKNEIEKNFLRIKDEFTVEREVELYQKLYNALLK